MAPRHSEAKPGVPQTTPALPRAAKRSEQALWQSEAKVKAISMIKICSLIFSLTLLLVSPIQAETVSTNQFILRLPETWRVEHNKKDTLLAYSPVNMVKPMPVPFMISYGTVKEVSRVLAISKPFFPEYKKSVLARLSSKKGLSCSVVKELTRGIIENAALVHCVAAIENKTQHSLILLILSGEGLIDLRYPSIRSLDETKKEFIEFLSFVTVGKEKFRLSSLDFAG
jgi:hypothetical protein